jgi:hypothetical protein
MSEIQQHAGDGLAVGGGGAEERARRPRALEVAVGVVLPGEADAAVDLDRLRRALEERVARVGRGGERRGDQVVGSVVRDPARLVDRRARRLDEHEQIGAHVLDGLERADRPAELVADLGVLDGEIETALGAADLLGGERDAAEGERALEPVAEAGPGLDADVVENDLGEHAAGVHRRQAVAPHARGAGRDLVEDVGADDQEIRGVAVDHVTGAAGQEEVIAGRGAGGDVARHQRGGDAAAGQLREDRGLLLVAGGAEDRGGGEPDRGQERHLGERPSELFLDRDHLDPAEPGAAVLLGDDQPGEQGPPEIRGASVERAADRSPQLFLLVAEREPHRARLEHVSIRLASVLSGAHGTPLRGPDRHRHRRGSRPRPRPRARARAPRRAGRRQ